MNRTRRRCVLASLFVVHTEFECHAPAVGASRVDDLADAVSVRTEFDEVLVEVQGVRARPPFACAVNRHARELTAASLRVRGMSEHPPGRGRSMATSLLGCDDAPVVQPLLPSDRLSLNRGSRATAP